MITKTFNRYEIKFFVPYELFDRLINKILPFMNYDEYCKNGENYTIYNIYYDTLNNDIIEKSLQKPYYKEKLRMRTYKMPTSKNDNVFLELKKKIGKIVNKRRAILPYSQAIDLIDNGIMPKTNTFEDRQVIGEIQDFLVRYNVVPTLFLSYERIALFGKDDRDLRISFDKNILARRTKVDFISGDYGNEIMDKDGYIMEIKCSGAIPVWLADILSQLKIYKTSFSKYGTEYKKYKITGEKTAC